MVETGLASRTFLLITAHWIISIFLYSQLSIFVILLSQMTLEWSPWIHLRGTFRWQGPLNFQPKQKFERPICVSWSTDMKGGRWTPSGCVVLEATETHTVCSCNRMANLAIIMASGELTVSTDALCSGSPNSFGRYWLNIRCVSFMALCVMGVEGGGSHRDRKGVCHASALGEFRVWLGSHDTHVSNKKLP